jgi:hypothetical protein
LHQVIRSKDLLIADLMAKVLDLQQQQQQQQQQQVNLVIAPAS